MDGLGAAAPSQHRVECRQCSLPPGMGVFMEARRVLRRVLKVFEGVQGVQC